MKDPRQLRIDDYTYGLPAERIATHPLPERDSSKLLISGDGHISEDVYSNISAHIPEGTLMVFNETKVVHARLLFHKTTGSVIEVFCLEPHERYPDVQTAMLQRGSVWWKCLVGGASKWKHGMVLSEYVEAGGFILQASIAGRGQGSFTIELSWNKEELTFAEVLHDAGKVPLPPYIHREADPGDEERYQTVYAKQEGSVAAPTAGLHFTQAVLDRLRQKNVSLDFVTLHVGAGTFKPVKVDTMLEHDMHAEWIDVDVRTIENLLRHLNKGIVAVGTTSLRTLESLYWIGVKLLEHKVPDLLGLAVHQWDPYELKNTLPAEHALRALADWMLQNGMKRLVTRTQILIAPGYEFKIIRGLVTNFHQPQSTLLLLVAALIGDDWRKVYEYALDHGFRFLSYGDGSLLWRRYLEA